MNVKQYYEIFYADKNGELKSVYCTSYSIFKNRIIIYDEFFEEKIVEHCSKRVTIKMNVTIDNTKKITDENYIYFS